MPETRRYGSQPFPCCRGLPNGEVLHGGLTAGEGDSVRRGDPAGSETDRTLRTIGFAPHPGSYPRRPKATLPASEVCRVFAHLAISRAVRLPIDTSNSHKNVACSKDKGIRTSGARIKGSVAARVWGTRFRRIHHRSLAHPISIAHHCLFRACIRCPGVRRLGARVSSSLVSSISFSTALCCFSPTS
jgi:hypothetical protein